MVLWTLETSTSFVFLKAELLDWQRLRCITKKRNETNFLGIVLPIKTSFLLKNADFKNITFNTFMCRKTDNLLAQYDMK